MSSTIRVQAVSEGRSVSECLVEALAAHEGIDAAGLDPPVYDVVDPEALDAVFRRGSVDGRIEFTFQGYQVVVRNGEPPSVAVGAADH